MDMPTSNPLPSHLLIWEPLEPEHVPLQVALLTMELAALVPRLAALEAALERLETTGSTALLGRDNSP
jgi:hypothetical protein